MNVEYKNLGQQHIHVIINIILDEVFIFDEFQHDVTKKMSMVNEKRKWFTKNGY